MIKRILLLTFALITSVTLFSQTDRYWVTTGDGNWNSTTNWSTTSGGGGGASVPNASTFRVIFDSNSGNPTVRVNLASFSLQQLWITGNQSVTFVSSGAARVITIGDGTNNSIPGASLSNADVVIEAGSTLIIQGETVANTMSVRPFNNANSQVRVAGTVRVDANGILANNTGPYFFNAGATYIHNRDGGNITTATWDASSNCDITGITTNAPTGLGQTFGNLTWNSAGQAGAVSLNDSPTVAGTFRFQNSNGQIVRLVGNANNRTLTVNNFIQDAGIFELSNRNANSGLLEVSGDFVQNGGIITKTGTNAANEIRFIGTSDATLLLNGSITGVLATPLLFNTQKTVFAKVILPTNQTFDATVQVRITSGTLDLGPVASTVTVNGPINLLTGGTIDMSGNADHKLYLRGATNTHAFGGTFEGGNENQTVYYDGDVNQNIMPLTYRHLVVSNFNAGSVNARTKTLSNGVLVEGDIIVAGVSATATVTLQIAGRNFSVLGQTNINAFGILNDNAAAGVNFFGGMVSINADGRWATTGNPPFIFRGGIVYNGAGFVSGTGTYTFNANNQTIEGTQPLTISNIVTTGITLTNRHTAGLTVATISGNGNFTNGDIGYNAILLVTAANPFTLTGTLDLATNPNTVDYFATGAQTIGAYNFYNLSTSGGRTNTSITLANGGVIGIAGVFNPLATFTTGNYITTNNTVNFNGALDQTVTALRATTPYNNLTISGNSTKTLTTAVQVSNVLNLNGGVLELDNYNLTISNNAANAIQGAFSSSNMISTNKSGRLIKNALSSQPLYPIGSGGYYSPMTLSAIAPTTGTLSIRAVPVALNPSYINKYWDITTSIARTSASATFQYDPAEQNGASQNISYSPDNGATFQNPPNNGTSSFGVNSFTITGTNPFAGWWTMGYKTFYSYQTGDWNNPTTWTTDPSGTLQIGTTIPGYNDRVVILTGRTVSLTSDITTQNLDITLNSGGTIDMGSFSYTNGLLALRGQGTLKLASANFPNAVTNTLVISGGGTVEYNAAINLPATPSTYNNLNINAPGSVVLLNNLTLFGNLQVVNGTFQINDNTPTRLRLIVNGNINVFPSGAISVGNGVTNTTTNPLGINGGAAPFLNYYINHSHRVEVYGNFTNEGTVRFTNLPFPIYNAFPSTTLDATTGFATVFFLGATNNTLTCEGVTDFYNLVVDKGTDQTFRLTINSSDYANFRLFGANIAPGENPGTDPFMKKALWLRAGTLSLDGFIVIPSLTEGTNGVSNPNSDFYIPASAALIIEDANVVLLVTADSYDEVNTAYGVSGGNGLVNGVSQGLGNSLQVIGSLEVNNGYLSTRESAGIVYTNSQIAIRGGVVDAKQFRPASGLGLVSYVQSGGELQLRGRLQRTPSAYTSVDDLVNAPLNTARANEGILRTDVGTFSINNALGVFNMSGGTIRIFDTPNAVNRRSFEVRSSTANYSVTGGTIVFEPNAGSGSPDATDWLVTSTAPLGNVTVNRQSSSTVVLLETGFPLSVLRNLSLQTGVFSSNNLNVTIGGNFTIQSGATYTHGTNTTILNGTIPQIFTVNTASALSLSSFSIIKAAGLAVTFAGSQKTIDVNGNFRLENGTLNDNGNTINLWANAYNSGLHNGTGKIVMANDAAQTIDGDGTGIFGNLELNKPTDGIANVTVSSKITVNGILSFTGSAAGYKQLNMQGNNLLLGSLATVTGADENRFVLFDGNFGDGGMSKVFSATSTSFSFPVATLNPTVRYTPATISISSAPSSWGTITVTPVKTEHPNTTTKNISLRYYWKVRSSGFSGLAAGSVTHSYAYSQDDVAADEADYIPARYDQSTFSWSFGNTASIDVANNIIGSPWLSNTNNIDGDYTAGDATPTNPFGVPTIFYSRQSGLWGDVNTWSYTNTNNHNPADNLPAGAIPGVNDIVIIGGRDSVTLATTNTVPNTDVRSCATLMIEVGSALDIGFNPASIFSVVKSHPNGNGNFRVTTSWTSGSTFAFPAGDFSDFNVNRGTTELYSTNPAAGTTYWLPNNISNYGNLILSPLGGSNIIFGNTDLIVYGNLVTRGQNADSWFCPTWVNLTPYPTAPTVPIAKTITVNGNLDIQGGGLIWIGNGGLRQDIVVHGDVIVAPWGTIAAWTGGGGANNQSLSIGGSLINNTNNANQPGVSTPSSVNLNNGASVVPVIFFGPSNASVTSSPGVPGPFGPGTFFNTVRVNKGTSQATTLTVNIGGTLTTPADNWLTLQSGTLIYQRTGNLTISTTTPFTIEAAAGLTINTPSTVSISNTNGNNSDLFLNGRLTLINGTVNIGQTTTPDNNNDIEYSGSGASALDIRGGSLFVNGQIRRNSTSLAGVLNYTQSGGTVTINGRAQLATRAKLEVLNTGSRFNMSGGTLTIVRGGGTTFGDLYLRPEIGSVTGGEIIFSQGAVDAAQTYSLDANISLNNLSITGKTAATARNATLNLMVSPLVLNGSLTLTNNQSFFNANNRNVTLRGDFINNNAIAAYTFGTNTTTFNGATQQIGGTSATNFHNLTISSTATVTLNSNTNIAGNLNITTGNLALGNIRATVQGNLTNNGSFTDNNSLTSGVRLNGAIQQDIAGTGSFGRLEINNSQGARTLNDITLQNDLLMTQGNLNIGQYLLSLGVNSNLGGAPFSQTKMIITDGVASSKGFRKFFNISATPQSYTFPVGVPSKYTPVSLTLDQNSSVGYIGISPVNNHHPAIAVPSSVLKYYWRVESAGISNIQGNMQMSYLGTDVNGVESDYIAAFLLSPGAYWSKAQPGPATDNVDETNNLISFGISSGTNNISGDYTAVTDGDLPDEVPSYITIADGNWSDENIWAPVGSSPPCPVGGPNGFNITIDHVVTTDVNYCFAYRTVINGTLRVVSPSFGHNIGAVEGTGTLYLESGNLPAGLFDLFLDCSNAGTLEYGGASNYTILASQFNSVPNLFFTGSGIRTLPDKDLTICHRLVIDGPTLDNNTHRRKLTILGTMERYNTGVFNAGTGATSIVSFAGGALQTLGGPTGNFTGTSRFNNLEISNENGLSIGTNGNIEIGSTLILTEGVINTTTNNRLTIFNTSAASVSPAGGSETSFVNGPLIKRMLNGGTFMYPLGKNVTKGHPFTFTNNSGATLNFTSEFFTPNNTYNALTSPLESTNSGEYWTIAASSGSRLGKVKVGWDANSDLTPTMTQNGLVDMRIAEFNTGTNRWEERASTTTGNASLGDVETLNNLIITTTPNSFTSASVTTTKPRAAFNPTGPVCGAAGIPIRFTSFSPINLNYTLDYTIDGVPQATVTVTSLPYVLPTPVSGVYQLTGFTYNNGAGTDGVVSPTTVTVNPVPTVASAGPDQSLCGASGVTLQGNAPAPFTGLWTIRSGTGGILLSPTSPNSVFNGQLGNTYVLRWTISSGGCTSWDEVTISFPVAAAMPSNFSAGPTSVCQGATVTYTVPAAASTTYTWSYSGTGANINGLGNPVSGIGNSVSVAFSSTATSGVISVTATNTCGTSPARTRNVTIVPLPDAPGIISGGSVVCQGEGSVAYSVPPIANATGYVWTLPTGGSIASGANTNSITVNYSTSATSGNVTVRGTNSCGSGPTSDAFAVTVNPMPTITLGSNPRICRGSSPALLSYTATTNTPDRYSIDFDVAAEGEGFVDVSDQALTISPIGITVPVAASAGSYNALVTVRNSVTGCASQGYSISIIVLPLPTSSITALNTSPTICEGEAVEMTIELTGPPPFEFTVQDNHGGSWTVSTLNSSYTFAVPAISRPVWISPDLPTIYKYTILSMTDDNGCTDVAPAGEAEVSVFKTPETGAQYHIPNSQGY